MQCAAERKYCAGVLRELRGRAAAQLRGNVEYNRASVVILQMPVGSEGVNSLFDTSLPCNHSC